MNKAKHDDFRLGGFVSIWLGNFTSEDELDNYLEESFASDFGFAIYTPDGPEASIEDEPVSIRRLLRDYSRSAMFIEPVIEAAEMHGLSKATTAIVFYNFKYDPEHINVNTTAPIAFIGVFPYSGF